jgi:hypothetical protein
VASCCSILVRDLGLPTFRALNLHRNALYDLAYTNNLPVLRGMPPREPRKKRGDPFTPGPASRLTDSLTAQAILSTATEQTAVSDTIALPNLFDTTQPGRSTLFDAIADQPRPTDECLAHAAILSGVRSAEPPNAPIEPRVPVETSSQGVTSGSPTSWSLPPYTSYDMTTFAHLPCPGDFVGSSLDEESCANLAAYNETSLWSTAPTNFQWVELVFFVTIHI